MGGPLTVCLFILRLFLPVTASTNSRHVGSSRRRDGRLLPLLQFMFFT